MGSWVKRATISLLVAACGHQGAGSEPAQAPIGVGASEPGGVEFAFDSLDERPVSSAAMRGRPTVIAFVTTYDNLSQAQVKFLQVMAEHDEGKVNYALVALQEKSDRELVEIYRSTLGVKFPVALADAATIAGGGPFGDVHRIPSVVVLDRSGRIAWQHTNVARSVEIRAALRGL
jgi:hypothetical protein